MRVQSAKYLETATEASLIVPAHVPEMPVEARLAHPLPADSHYLRRS
jgi:hypothetical protein